MTAKTRIPMDMHNCFRECGSGEETLPRNASAVVANDTRDLIEALSRKHPKWHFINREYSFVLHNTADYAYSSFVIEEAGDELGTISAERHWRTAEVWYNLTNHRLAAKRSRQGPTRTKDIKKAVKLVERHYYGPTLAERIATARSSTNATISTINSDSRWALDKVMRDMQPELIEFISGNPDIRAQLASSAPKYAKQIEALPGLAQDRRTTQRMEVAKGSGSNTVMLFDDKLYLLDAVDPNEPHTFDTVPKHIAMAVGMLKLVDIKGFIPDIGVRTGHNVFYVIPPQENNQ